MKNRKTRSAMRRMLFTLALVLVVAAASVGGTIAWLKASTEPVINTFTVGDINIDLYETVYPDGTEKKDNNDKTTRLDSDEWKAKLIPGKQWSKNPVVVVEAGSEPCWLFVEMTGTVANLSDDILHYELNLATNGWQQGQGTGEGKDGIPENVYYKKVDLSTDTLSADGSYTWHLLNQDSVLVRNTVTKNDIKNLTASEYTMTFKAYAIQQDGFDTAAKAWDEAQKAN